MLEFIRAQISDRRLLAHGARLMAIVEIANRVSRSARAIVLGRGFSLRILHHVARADDLGGWNGSSFVML